MVAIRALFDNDNREGGIAQALGAQDIASAAMQEAIRSWIIEYFRRVPGREADPCQRLP